jgi:hypothetical protein
MGAARRSAIVAVFVVLAAAAATGDALAAGGDYGFDGGTRRERQTVVSALDASAFPWSLVPAHIVIRIRRGADSDAVPGLITLDADLLDSGTFAWGVVQHEYAHQVDFFLLDDATRTLLGSVLGGDTWCYSTQTLPHAAYGCERFASTLAWAYWPVPANCMQPTSTDDEAAAMEPARFRSLLADLFSRGGRMPLWRGF